jgi:hypothetical protein
MRKTEVRNEDGKAESLTVLTQFYERAKTAKAKQTLRMKLDLLYYQGEQYAMVRQNRAIVSPDTDTIRELRDKNVILATQNRIRPAARVLISKITQRQPMLYCLPMADGEKAKQSASAASDLLSDIRHRKFYLNKDVLATEWMVTCGKAFKMPFPKVTNVINPETGEEEPRVEVDIAVYSPFEVLLAPGVVNAPDSPRIILQRYTDIGAIEQRYDCKIDNDEDSTNADDHAALDFEADRKGDLRLVREYLELPTPKRPRGRHIVAVEDKVVYDDEFPYWDNTADGREVCSGYRLIPYDFDVTLTSAWPDGLVHNCLDEQKKINLLWTQWVTYVAHCTTPKLKKGKKTVLPPDFWMNVPTSIDVGEGDEAPEWLRTAEINPAVQAALTEAKQAFDDAAGIHSVTNGNEPKNRMPFLAIQYVTELDLEKYGSVFDRYEESERMLGTAILKTIQQFAGEYPYRVLGKNRETEIKTFMADDMDDHEVVVERGSGLPESKAGKIAQLIEMAHNNAFDLTSRPTRVSFFKALDTGWSRDMIAGETHSLDLAEAENGMLLSGEPVTVHPMHDHELHLSVVRRILDGPEFYHLDPLVMQAVEAHANQHQAFLLPPPAPGLPTAPPAPDGPPAPPDMDPTALPLPDASGAMLTEQGNPLQDFFSSVPSGNLPPLGNEANFGQALPSAETGGT